MFMVSNFTTKIKIPTKLYGTKELKKKLGQTGLLKISKVKLVKLPEVLGLK